MRALTNFYQARSTVEPRGLVFVGLCTRVVGPLWVLRVWVQESFGRRRELFKSFTIWNVFGISRDVSDHYPRTQTDKTKTARTALVPRPTNTGSKAHAKQNEATIQLQFNQLAGRVLDVEAPWAQRKHRKSKYFDRLACDCAVCITVVFTMRQELLCFRLVLEKTKVYSNQAWLSFQ